MKTCIGYCRVSTSEQARQGVSLNYQESKIRLQSELSEFDLIDIIKDEGQSAKNLNRIGLQKIISLIKARKVQAIIIYKLDRLTRNVSDLNNLIQLFNKYDVSLISVKDNLDTQSAGGRMIVNMLGVISQWEREVIGERVQEGLKQKKSQKEKTGGTIPFGFQLSHYVSKGKKRVPVLKENPVEQEVIKLMESLYKKGYSYRAICRELEKDGYKTKTGSSRWNHKVIRGILKAV